MKAIIFGLGGVLIDSEQRWQEDQMEFFQRYGEWTAGDQARTIGADIGTLHKYILRKGFRIGREELERLYDRLDLQVYGTECALYPDVRETLERLGRTYRLALATSTRRKNLELVLDRFNLHDFFGAALSMDDVSASKPSPNVYLQIARMLDVAPRECVVVDDSDHGITSAREAGMASIGIRGTIGQSLHDAQIVLDDVRETTEEMIEDPWRAG